MNNNRFLKKIRLIFLSFLLFGFHRPIFNTSGIVSIQQYKLIFIAFITMLCIVIPVILMTLLFVYRYRASKMNTYNPDFKHSNLIESIVWIVPIIIIIFLGSMTWRTSYELDPKKHIINKNHAIKINVVALDWNWLFIYPKQHVATINELILPNDTPVIFNITSYSVMNAFFIPSLGSQVYAMPGMKSILHLMAIYPGKYHGFSSNYNGKGFSNMKFDVIILPTNHMFNKWIRSLRNSLNQISNLNDFNVMAQPSLNKEIKYFSFVYSNLFKNLVNHNITC